MKYLLLTLLGLLVLILFIDWLQKRFYKNVKWSRKATHTLTGLIICTFPYFLQSNQIIIIAACFTVALTVSKFLNVLSLHNVKRKTWGEVLFPIGVGLTAGLSLPEHQTAYLAGILCLSLADTAANVFGNLLPIKPIFIGKHKKSVGGFLGCYLTVFIILAVLYAPLQTNWPFIIVAAFLISTTELISVYGTDNISVPTITAVICILI